MWSKNEQGEKKKEFYYSCCLQIHFNIYIYRKAINEKREREKRLSYMLIFHEDLFP